LASSSARVRARYVTVGLVLLALFSTISPLGHGQTLPSTAVQHDSLLFTVSPDKSVGIGWNTTTFSPVLQNASMIFPPGYVIQSSSSFSQQASSVVETTTVHYQLPQRLNQNLSSIVSSMSFNATQTGLSGQGSLRITTTTLFPVQNINVTYSTSSNRISINATAHYTLEPPSRVRPLSTTIGPRLSEIRPG